MKEKFCGVWGHMREEYLRAHEPRLYNLLLEEGEMEEYLTSYQTAYSGRAERMAEKLATERGVNSQLYENDSLEWILATEKIQEDVQTALKKEIQK